MKAKVFNFVRGLRNGTPPRFQSYLKSLTLLLTMLLSVNVWGAITSPWTYTFVSPDAISSNSITKNGVTWSVATTSGAGSPTISAANSYSKYGLKFGSSKSIYFGSVTFSTDAFKDYNVTAVTVKFLNNGSKAATFTVTQGDVTLGSASATFGTTWTDLTVDKNTTSYKKGNGGTLSFTYSVEQAFFINAITVTFEEGSSSTTYYLAGSMNDWSTTADQFTGTPLSVTKNLSANTSYTFKVATNGTWDTSYGKDYNINRQYCTDITLDGTDNVTLQTDKAGNYTFNITINSSGKPVLSVVYPADTWQLAGFDNWGNKINFVNGSCQVTLTAKEYTYNTDAGFKLIKNGSDYYGCNGTMTRSSCTNWTFYTGESNKNCGITADEAGTYTFTINTSGANPQLTVTYPVASLKSIAEVIDATASTEKTLTVTMNNWVITAVSGNQFYITDGTLNGMLCYFSGHGFAAGDHLSGTIEVKSKVYNQQPEFTSLRKGMTGLITTSGSLPTPIEVTDLATVNQVENQGILISFKNAPYNANGYFEYDEDDNFINYEDKFNTGFEPQGGSNYDVTGLVCATYSSSTLYLNVAPLKASDIQEVVAKYDASFDANGHGTAPATQSQVSSVTLAAITGVTGWTNDYWTANVAVKDGSNNTIAAGTHLNNGTTYKLTANTTFTAHWQIHSHTLTWDFDGGSTTSSTSEYTHGTVEYGATIIAPADPTKANKKFAGWMQNSVVVTPATTMPDNNLTYVAKWRDITWTDYLTDCSAPYTWTIWYQDPSDSQWKDAAITDDQAQFTLAKESTFNFKLRKTNVDDPRDPEDYTYYGPQNTDNSYTTSGTQWTLDYINGEIGHDVHVATGAAGVYTINVTNMTGDEPQITVTYPTAYTITFAGNGADGGSMTNVTNIAAGENVVLAANAYTKTGNHFKGWVADVAVKIGGETKIAGTLIADGATIQDINSNITLTAQWETKVTALTISQESGIYEIVEGEDLQLTLTVTPNDAEYGTTYTWYTSNSATMTVSQSGVVTGVQANTGDYIYVRNNDGVESNHYVINVKSAACDTWGLHMWNTGNGTFRDFCFSPVGSTTEWRTQQVTLPSNSDNEQLKVLYAGKDGYHTAQWTTRKVPTVGYQQGGCDDDSDGNRYAGQDAKGYFRIYSDSESDNYYLAFQPVYAVIYGVEGQTWQQVEFTDTETANNFYTDIITVPEGYNSNVKIYAGTSKASGVNFISGRSNTVNMNTITGLTGSGMAGKAGKFKINDNYCNESNFNLSFERYYRLNYNLDEGAGTGDYTDKFVLPSASEADRTFTLETAPTRDGYTFLGWSVSIGGGEATTKQPGESVVLTEDAVATAQWAKNYTVTYDLAGYSTSCSSSTVHYCGEEVTVCPAPEDKTGYTFKGWNTDDITGSAADYTPGATFTMPCNDVVFTAHYQADSYTITYEGLEGASNTNPATYTIEDNITFVAPGTRTGYTFTSWTENGTPITGITAGTTGNKTITANWSLNSHNVTFDANGHGTAPTGYANVNYGALVTKPTDPADVDESGDIYTFIGWYKEAGCTNAWDFATDVMPDADLTLYAKWSGVTYEDYRTHCCTPLDAPTGGAANDVHMTTATLSWNEVTNNNGYQVSADQTSWENVLSGTSYDLTGLTAGTPYIYYVRAIGDDNVYCQYGTSAQIVFTTKAALHITYKANSGTGADVVSADIEEGTSATVADNTFTAPTGMSFNGWNTQADGEGTAYAVGATINPLNADLTLYAQWKGETYNITYNLNGGAWNGTAGAATYEFGTGIPTLATNVEKTGFSFQGWYSNEGLTEGPVTTIASDATGDKAFWAKWATAYTVTFIDRDNEPIVSYAAEGDHVVFPADPECGIYSFLGWAITGEISETTDNPGLTYYKSGDDYIMGSEAISFRAVYTRIEGTEACTYNKITSGVTDGEYVLMGQRPDDFSYLFKGHHSSGYMNVTRANYEIGVTTIDEADLPTGDNAPVIVTITVSGGTFAIYDPSTSKYLTFGNGSIGAQDGIWSNWKLTTGSQVSEKACPAGAISSTDYLSSYVLQVRNTSYSDRLQSYANTQNNYVYLFKKTESGTRYYTTNPVCDIPTQITVTYDANGKEGTTLPANTTLDFTDYPNFETYNVGHATDVTDWHFAKWNTQANGLGTDYAADVDVTTFGLRDAITLYAIWETVYTVTLHDNGATSTKTQASEGAAIDLGSGKDAGDCDLDDDGTADFTWKFEGWTTNNTTLVEYPVCPEVVANRSEYVPEANVDLYAVYSRPIENTTDFAVGVSGAYIVKDNNDAQYLGAKTSGDVFAFNAVTAQSDAIVIKLVENDGSYNVATDAGFVEWDNSTSMRYEQLMNGHWTISGSAGNWSMQESAGSRYLCWNTTTRFNLQQSKRTVDLIPTTGTYYFSNPVCQNAFDITFEVRGGEINYGEALPEDYTGLESGAEVAEFPTIDMRDDLMDWTFVGWTTVDYNTQHELDDENASTEAPTSTIYRTGGTNTFTMPSTNVTLYPVFTSAIANEPMDLENGGDYYIYFTSTKQGFHDPYTEIDGQTIRIYAQQVAEHEATAAFASTTSCANAQLFHFEQREAGKWDIRLWNNAGDDYITKSYLTNPEPNDNDFASQGAQPDDYWTIEQLSDGSFKAQYSVNAGSKYFMKGLVNSPETQASATFKCYNQDCDNSNQYYAVYLGSCVERTFSADPMPQASLRLEGTVNVTSRTGVAVRAANSLTLKGIKLEAGQKVTISSTNSDIYFSDTKEVNMSKADKPVNPLKITVPASGSMDMPIYVHYQPTATEDGIDQVDVVASYSYATTELEKSVKVRARHLPEQVVIAAKIDNQWYALPANLNGATNPLVTPITVDETTMTAEAPTSCAYTLWPVKTTATANDRYQEVGERVRFSAANNGNKGLWASDAKDSHTTINNNAAITGIAADPAAPNYEWAISTNDLQVYTLTATGDNNTSKLSVARPTSGGNQGQLVWGTYGTNVTAEVYLLPFITFTDMQATVVEWFQDKVLVELANGALWTAMSEASAQTQSRIGSAEWATAAAVDYTTYGTNMCTFNTGTLTSSYGQNLSVKTVVEETTYQTTLVVPIIIGNNKSVTDAPFSTITPAKYNTMDVVVRDGAVLTLNGTSDEQTTFNTITVEPSSKVVVNSDRNLGASLITLRGGYDEIYSGGSYTMGYDEPQLYIGGTSSATQINYEKRVDLDQMHGMSVPFEVEQTAITYLNGTSVKAGGNLYIDAYDGENRAQYSGTKSSWYYYDEKITPLYRGIGYTISAEPAVDGQNYTMLRAPMSTYWTKAVPGSESVAEVQVYAWGSESAIRDNHKGWNCLGNPYMANFGKADDATFGGKLYLGKLVETLDDKGNWTGGYHWDESTVRYVTIPHDDGHGFDQVRVQDAVLKPFRHFFVQVQTEGTLQFAKTDIQNSVVARATNDEPKEIELGILMSNGQATDNCGLLIGDDFSEGYEMMSDLGKELGQAMAIYTITGEYKLAFNAMNEDYAKGYIPVGYLAPKAGEYTISFDNDRYDIAPSVEHIYLLENGTPVADLKSVDYDFETTAGINDDRFALSIVFNHNIGTDLSGADSMDEMPVKIVHNDKMYILMHGRVYSTTGKFIKEIKK